MKYNEERIIEEISRYIKGTYGEHYSTTKDGFQVQDLLRHLEIDKDFCQANAIKYLCRYGKKAGKNRKDLISFRVSINFSWSIIFYPHLTLIKQCNV